jgi:hypothetical protein
MPVGPPNQKALKALMKRASCYNGEAIGQDSTVGQANKRLRTDKMTQFISEQEHIKMLPREDVGGASM